MIDYTQTKLIKREWENLEVPLDSGEKEILRLIQNGYSDVDYCYNDSLSLLNFMKLCQGQNNSKNVEKYDNYLYFTYFKTMVETLIKENNLDFQIKFKKDKVGLKKADLIRIENTNKKFNDGAVEKNMIYEYVLLDQIKKYFERDDSLYYYNVSVLIQNNILLLNRYVKTFVLLFLDTIEHKISKKQLIKNSAKTLENNSLVHKLRDKKLYDHQKELFEVCKRPENKLIFYQAPTGTGKTMSPLGLVGGKKVIFVCAAKHVGLQLARACISMQIPIGVAFGCSDPGDVRLHYYAAKEYTKNYKSGGIFHVDHSVGDKVQLIVSDVTSYLSSMYYLTAFTENPEDIIMYWDEPTISMDYTDHELHGILKKIWKENVIPNVVLSSATLPSENELKPCIESMRSRFPDMVVETVASYDCKKSIPLMNVEGYYVMPHTLYENYDDLMSSVKHCLHMKTTLRYFNLKEVCKCVLKLNEFFGDGLEDKMKLDNYFTGVGSINSVSLKIYYLELLELVKREQWGDLFEYFTGKNKRALESNIYVTTKDAHTLKYGPTLFLAENVDKIAKFCFQSAKIPHDEVLQVLDLIKQNDKIKEQVEKLRKQLSNKEDDAKEDPKKTRVKQRPGDDLRKKIEKMESTFKCIELNKKYVPNTHSHMYKYAGGVEKDVFVSDVDEKIVEKIMLLDDVEDLWKVLLVMGIGVFSKNQNVEYLEIMKKLAYEQKLYLIIASSDYIYGTNYQFCHEYISKDLEGMSQEKMIQALGRIGRSQSNQTYSIRLRSNVLLDKVFQEETNKIEVKNMNRLFGIC